MIRLHRTTIFCVAKKRGLNTKATICDLTYMWTAHLYTLKVIALPDIQKRTRLKLWMCWLGPEIPELQCAGSRLLHIQYVAVMLLYNRDDKSNAKQWNPSWPKWHSYQPRSTLAGLSKALLLDWEKCLARINELLHFVQLDDGAFLWPELFLFRGAGAGLIRDRPAAALSLAERPAHPCCLIGTGLLLTRASYQQGKQTVNA